MRSSERLLAGETNHTQTRTAHSGQFRRGEKGASRPRVVSRRVIPRPPREEWESRFRGTSPRSPIPTHLSSRWRLESWRDATDCTQALVPLYQRVIESILLLIQQTQSRGKGDPLASSFFSSTNSIPCPHEKRRKKDKAQKAIDQPSPSPKEGESSTSSLECSSDHVALKWHVLRSEAKKRPGDQVSRLSTSPLRQHTRRRTRQTEAIWCESPISISRPSIIDNPSHYLPIFPTATETEKRNEEKDH